MPNVSREYRLWQKLNTTEIKIPICAGEMAQPLMFRLTTKKYPTNGLMN